MANIPQKEANRKPFKIISVTDLRRLTLEIPPPALAVWLCHYSHSGADGTSALSLETIVAETGLELKTVQRCRAWLRKNGWIISSGLRHATRGRFSVPIERAVYPAHSTVGAKSTYGRRGCQKHLRHASAKSTTEVDLEPNTLSRDATPKPPQPVIVFQNENPEAKIRRLKRTLRCNPKLVPSERARIEETLRNLEKDSRESEPAHEAARNEA